MATENNTTETPTARKSNHWLVSLSDLALHDNPRKDLLDIKGLAATIIAAGGVTQPLSGYKKDGKFMIIDGQRRFTSLNLIASQGEHPEVLKDIPFMTIGANFTEADILFRQIVSNEGEPLKPLELAEAVLTLMTGETALSSDVVAARLGKSKVYVNQLKRLAELPELIKALIREGSLSATLVREKMKNGGLDAFIADIQENGFNPDKYKGEGEGSEGEGDGSEGAKKKKKKITNKEVTLNSMKEFKRFAKQFSEVFPNTEKQKIYEFASDLLHNKLTFDEIMNFFIDDTNRHLNTAEHAKAKEAHAKAEKKSAKKAKVAEAKKTPVKEPVKKAPKKAAAAPKTGGKAATAPKPKKTTTRVIGYKKP